MSVLLLCKNSSRAIWTGLAFLLFNTQYRASMPLQIATLLSKSGSVSNILSFVLSMLKNISKSAFNMKFFPSVTSSGTSSSFVSQPLCQRVCLHWVPLAAYAESQTAAMSTFLQSAIYSIISLMFSYGISLFISLLKFHQRWAISSFDYPFL